MTTSGGSGAARAGRPPVTFRALRWLAYAAQALVLLGLPFLRVGGESALRLDVPTGRLHAFGAALAVDEAFVVLAATLLVTALFLLGTVLFGRAWCGWACPQTVLGDLTPLVEPPARGGHLGRRAAGIALAAVVSAIVGADLVWWFVSPWDFAARLAAGALGPVIGWAWGACAGVLFLDLVLVRQTFCATVCPYAKLQGVLFDRHTLVVAYDERRDADCVDCLACVRVCPTGIDIRDGLQTECIACAACVDACAPIMRRLGRGKDLVGYFHGAPGGRRRLLRPATAGLAALTLAAAGLLAGAAWGRPLVALTVSADPAFAPRRAADGRVVNAFDVVLESRARGDAEVTLSLDAGPSAAATVRPGRLTLAPGELRRLRLLASVRADGAGASLPARLAAEVRLPGRPPERVLSPLTVVLPEAP